LKSDALPQHIKDDAMLIAIDKAKTRFVYLGWSSWWE